jgi:hypothetical protein
MTAEKKYRFWTNLFLGCHIFRSQFYIERFFLTTNCCDPLTNYRSKKNLFVMAAAIPQQPKTLSLVTTTVTGKIAPDYLL